MFQIENRINSTEYNGLKIEKINSIETVETLLIVLEKSHTFPEHTSPKDVFLVLLEGEIDFSINSKSYQLQKHQIFPFPANEKHSIFAKENSKFLIIR